MASDDTLWRLTARETVKLLRQRQVSPAELVDIAAARIAATDPALNALPTLCIERAYEKARLLDRLPADHPGWLAGLPIAVKDLEDVEGVRTTYGSPIFGDNVPRRTDLGVQALEQRGALVVAKSNTPEFGAGAQTFNEVFGVTRNPWDTRMTCAGSSGGAAVAVAAGQVWLATGSDLGGSLRTPASFCSVVGLRPSPGRVPHGPTAVPLDPYAVNGPMGRTVGDVALMLDAYAGYRAGDPISLDAPATPFQWSVDNPTAPRRIGWTPDLGQCPVDPEVRDICVAAVQRFSELGTVVEDRAPDCEGAREAFQTMRAHNMAIARRRLLEKHRDKMKPEVIWNIQAGLKLTAADIRRATVLQAQLYQRFVAFFNDYDLLALPTAIAPPFPVEKRYLDEVAGVKFETYVDWILITSIITMTGCPAISIPCGFTRDGLPVGLQLVGRPRGEAALLSAAALFEALMGIAPSLPIDPRVRH